MRYIDHNFEYRKFKIIENDLIFDLRNKVTNRLQNAINICEKK